MKILTIGNFGVGWDGSICDEEHIAKALEDMGHTVDRVQREDSNHLFKTDEFQDYDFILLAQWDGYIRHLGLSLKESFKCPIVYWAFDYQADGQEWHENLVKGADLYLSKRIADYRYINWQWFSQDFAPQFLDEYPGDIEPTIDVMFTGTYLPWATERNEILKAVDDRYKLEIHSVNPDSWKEAGFKRVFGPRMDDELPHLIATAKVHISIDHTIEAGYWSDRNAQIMACKGLVLFKYVPMSEHTFHDHIVYFHDKEDCLHRLEQILEHPDEDLWSVAQGGYDYAQEYLKVSYKVRELIIAVERILV